MYHFNKKKILFCCTVVGLLLLFFHSNNVSRKKYDYIMKENIISSLHVGTSENYTSTAYVECEYYDVIYDETSLPVSLVDADLEEIHKIKEGGEYAPSECKPKYSTAIIVPYRDRAEQLRGFLVYMHSFLHHQHIHYRIYVIEQVDTHPFNRAKLLNIGALAAMQAGYPCLIFHDVDLLPVKISNIYACLNAPRHMSSNINSFRFALPYLNIFGGAISILSNQYKKINGMNNNFYATSGDNDDLYSRIEASNLKLCRFDPTTSEYYMTTHNSEFEIEQKKSKLTFSKKSMLENGLNSIEYTEVATVLHPLFTHIMVDL
ncbi:beta-1,4-galactosyltransferase 1-like [Colias croceus]|uniref:beta-1,4-galactosyltransferase 1-like n=1 Tax=Colias crocea TaxID=72248 RepID=UPI001E27E53C|nr:beta-1,4-galactosyltransferase 1-like [Colias croceus]